MSRMFSCLTVALVVAMVILAGGCSSSSSPPISVSLSPSSSQGTDQGGAVAITATVTNGQSGGVSWTLTGPGSLSSSTGQSVTYNAPTTGVTSQEQATVTATSTADRTKSASLQIAVNPYPQVSFQALAGGSVGAAYSQTIAFTGGTAPFQWSVYDGPISTGWEVRGAVPDGLTLGVSTGIVSGTPTGGGTWYFLTAVTDATGVVAYYPLSIQINPSVTAGNPIPFLNQTLVPTAVSPGSSGFTLKVSGTGFLSSATVNFNGAALATTFVDSEHLSATVPAADVANAGAATVTVGNPGPGGGLSNVVDFQVGDPEATVTFAPAPNSPLQISGAFALAIADFNEDGKPDLAVSGSYDVYVMLGNGDGTFTAAAGSPMPVPSPPYDDFPSPLLGQGLALGDFNHSGHTGLAAGLLQNEAAAIFFGNGDGTFGYSSTLANTLGDLNLSLNAADFNGDGNLDMVAGNTLGGATPVILLGYSHGAFNANPIFQSVNVVGWSLGTGDFNGDGKLDLAVGGPDILLGNGDGTFTQGPALSLGGFVTVGDFNGGGKLDLAVADNLNNTVTILLGDGTGNFTPASGSPIAVGSQPQAILAADFNNDGKLDLATANSGDGTVTLLLGEGNGTFTEASGSPYSVGGNPYAISAADFNGDGKLDLALAGGAVWILLQQ
jgi:hypothetical protein